MGGLEGPPKPPALGSAPAQPPRSSIPPALGSAPAQPPRSSISGVLLEIRASFLT